MRYAIRSFVALALIALWAPTAGAETRAESGWWTVSPILAAGDVPEDGLLVQGGHDAASPLAFAAASFTVDPDARPTTLKIDVVPDSLSTPNAAIVACPLTTSFTPAHGAPATEAPEFDCSTNVVGQASSDGTSYSFDVTSFVRDRAISTAIIPTTASTRVVFHAPSDSSLEASSVPIVAPTAPAPIPGAKTDEIATSASDPSAPSGNPVLPEGAIGPSAPVTVAPPVRASAPAAAALAPTLPALTSVPAPTALATLLVLGGVIAGAAIWARVGQSAVRTVRQAESGDAQPSYS